ncbi:MAG: hypothetical protein ABSG41_27385, partial [Bryobacteraceae bacterium]
MSTYRLSLHLTGLLLLFSFRSIAQTSNLSISSAVVNPGGTATLSVALTVSGTAPAGLEWTISYSPAQISAISITPGPAVAAAVKTLSCSSGSGVATCILTGMNANNIGSGVVAYLNATVASGTTAASIQISNPNGVDSNGNGLAVASAVGGTITVPTLSPVTCSLMTLSAGAVSTCTVTLTQTAPAGGSVVTLASNNTLLTVPASVTVVAGATTATFSVAAAASIASNQSATVTATLSTFGQISLVHVTACGPQVFPTITCSIPATASGNLLVIGWMSNNGGGGTTIASISDNASGGGNNYSEAGNARALEASSNSMADLWYARNSQSGATVVTINPNPSGTAGTAVIWEFSGVNTTNPLDQSAVLNSQPATTIPIGPSLAITSASELIISVATVQGTATGILAGNPFTSDSTANGNGWAHLLSSVAGTYAAQWNNPSDGAYAASAASFASGGISSQTATISLVAPALVSGIACSPTSLGQSAVSTCTVTLTQTAPTGGSSVTLGSNNTSLTVPASVTVAAGATTATFSATAAASIASNQSATVTATLGSSSQTATISLLAPVLVSGVACSPTSLGQSAVSTCTVTLTQTAPTGGSSVALASNNTLLTVPASVTVTAGATTATFSATAAGSIASNQSATVTGTLGSSSQTATISLVSGVATAAFVTSDTTTQGTWKGVYGADGEAINSDSTNYPGYAQVSFSGSSSYVWASSSTDVRALQKAAATDRIASVWYTSSTMSIDVNLTDGYTHQVALYALDWDYLGRAERVDVLDASSSAVLDTRTISGFSGGQYLVWNLKGHVTLKITLTGGLNAVVSGLFFAPPVVDLNISKTHSGNFTQGLNGATYSVTVSNGAGAATTSGTVTVTEVIPAGLTLISMSGTGWACPGGTTCTRADALAGGASYPPITVTANVAANAPPSVTNQVSVSGGGSAAANASDPAIIAANGGPVIATAAFVTSDTTSQGTWKGAYGADGEAIYNDSASYPGYAQVSFSGNSSYVWTSSTTDVRAPQKSAATDRIASTWYTYSTMSIDVNLTDGYTHQVALYALDWDNGGRAERVDVV